MVYRILADAVLLVHLGFVLFVVLGGLLVLRRRRVAWLHVPAAVWGALIELADWICPLTPLENMLRQRAGEQAYAGGFIEHYVLSILYPDGLTVGVRIGLGLLVIAVNGSIYGWIFLQRPPKIHTPQSPAPNNTDRTCQTRTVAPSRCDGSSD